MTIENVGSYAGLLKQTGLIDWEENGTVYKSAYIYNIPESSKDVVIAARLYVELEDADGNTIFYYSSIQEKSVTSVYESIVQAGHADLLDEAVRSWWN